MGSFWVDIFMVFAEFYKGLTNVIIFVVSNTLHNLAFIQKSLLTYNC